jgi:hypothetical protein
MLFVPYRSKAARHLSDSGRSRDPGRYPSLLSGLSQSLAGSHPSNLQGHQQVSTACRRRGQEDNPRTCRRTLLLQTEEDSTRQSALRTGQIGLQLVPALVASANRRCAGGSRSRCHWMACLAPRARIFAKGVKQISRATEGIRLSRVKKSRQGTRRNDVCPDCCHCH